MITRDDHRFLVLSVQEKRAYVARCMGCNPGTPETWPEKIVDQLMALRVNRGPDKFYEELGRMLSSSH